MQSKLGHSDGTWSMDLIIKQKLSSSDSDLHDRPHKHGRGVEEVICQLKQHNGFRH